MKSGALSCGTNAASTVTDEILRRLFATRALAPACDVAEALGIDEKTLRRLTEAGAVRAVLIGETTRRYTEADLRAYLAGETALCPSTGPSARRSGSMTSSLGVVDFTALRAKERTGRQAIRRSQTA